ncbi:MAG: haloacid dehalogenase domain-containing protein hydrolase [candidate division NC10 bacterium CSP1-5]|nr:MAG: haloacid dehalogenase domain-containing protein hydrolase [candidate division NC10 bacterium CSP1-5]
MSRQKPPLRAVVLDFDGVIVESLDVKAEAFAILFAEHREHVEAIVRLHRENGGMSRYEKFRIIYRDYLQQPLDPATMAALDLRFSSLVRDRVIAAPFVPGAAEFIRTMAGRLPLYVVSGTPQEEIRAIMRARGLDALFRGVYGSPTAKGEWLTQIAAREGGDPSRIIFIGDGRADLEGARQAGMRFIGRVPPGDRDPFGEGTIDARVADLRNIGDILESLFTVEGQVSGSGRIA